VAGFERQQQQKNETERRRKERSLSVNKRFVCVFVHVWPSGYLNANEGDHDGLGCSQSRLHIINIHVSRSLCVSWRRKCSLGSSAQDGKKKVNTFSYLRCFILFSFFLSLQQVIARPAKKLIPMKILWTITAAQISVSSHFLFQFPGGIEFNYILFVFQSRGLNFDACDATKLAARNPKC